MDRNSFEMNFGMMMILIEQLLTGGESSFGLEVGFEDGALEGDEEGELVLDGALEGRLLDVGRNDGLLLGKLDGFTNSEEGSRINKPSRMLLSTTIPDSKKG